MKDRFALESDINAIFATVDDLKCVADMMYDSSMIFTPDAQHTVLQGIAITLDAKMERLQDTFCQVFQLNEYAPDDVKAARDEFMRTLKEETEDE